MPVYTVHAPKSYGADVRTKPEKVVFVRDGFYVWAFLIGLFWLIWNRLWLTLIGYIVIQFAVEVALRKLGASADARLFVMFVIALFMGLEAGSLKRWTFSRGKWRQIDVIVADDEETAERRFFDRWPPNLNSRAPLPPLPRSSLTPSDPPGFFPVPGSSQ
jgi:hypothetical protein